MYLHIVIYLFKLEGCSEFCFLKQDHLAEYQSNIKCVLAVSYTHLDVYKRQHTHT